MASLLYGDKGIVVSVDDRALWHLQLVIVAKLRRQESFVFSWVDDDSSSGRGAIWLDPASTLYFRYRATASHSESRMDRGSDALGKQPGWTRPHGRTRVAGTRGRAISASPTRTLPGSPRVLPRPRIPEQTSPPLASKSRLHPADSVFNDRRAVITTSLFCWVRRPT
ncbi:DUF7882 family protein [Cryobacterium melibiosiphilum]